MFQRLSRHLVVCSVFFDRIPVVKSGILNLVGLALSVGAVRWAEETQDAIEQACVR